jgi:hypothetical protein
MTIPPHRNTLAFQGSISVGKRVPAKASITLGAPNWVKESDQLGYLVIADKKYSETANSSSLQVTLQNNAAVAYQNLTVYTVLSNTSGDAVDFSKTVIDSIPPNGGTTIAPFTWPISHNSAVVSIEVLPVFADPSVN